MWALVDKDAKIVLACIHNDKYKYGYTHEKALELAGDNLLIEMTLENSPAWVNGKWDGAKFYEPEGVKI